MTCSTGGSCKSLSYRVVGCAYSSVDLCGGYRIVGTVLGIHFTSTNPDLIDDEELISVLFDDTKKTELLKALRYLLEANRTLYLLELLLARRPTLFPFIYGFQCHLER